MAYEPSMLQLSKINRCAAVYIVVSSIATVVVIASCCVPLFIVTDEDASSSTMATMMAHHVPGAHQAIAASRNVTLVTAQRRVAEAQSVDLLKCPLYGGSCWGPSLRVPSLTTEELLDMVQCDDGLDLARAGHVIAVLLAATSTACQLPALVFEPFVRRAKLASFIFGIAAVICASITWRVELSISKCLHDSSSFTYTFDGDYLVMVSTIVLMSAGCLQAVASFGMLSSFWLRCLGDPPPSHYIQFIPTQQQQQQQQAYIINAN